MSALLSAVLILQGPAAPDLTNSAQLSLTLFHVRESTARITSRTGEWQPMGGSSVESENVGLVFWTVTDAEYGGKPAKLFSAESTWRFFIRRKDQSKVWFSPKVYVQAWLDPARGKLIRTVTSYAGAGQPTQVDAEYSDTEIDQTVTIGSEVRDQVLSPVMPVSRFHDVFRPLLRDGIVERPSHEVAMLHPYTGAPMVVKVEQAGRFSGKMFDLPHEGYKFRVVSPYGTVIAFVSRHGQLLRIETLREFEGNANEGPTHLMGQKWGRFMASHWNQRASVTHPDRPRFKTFMLPVLLDNPRLIYPHPFVLAV